MRILVRKPKRIRGEENTCARAQTFEELYLRAVVRGYLRLWLEGYNLGGWHEESRHG